VGRDLEKKTEDKAEHPHKVLSGSIQGISKPEMTKVETCGEHVPAARDSRMLSQLQSHPRGAVALVAKLVLLSAVSS